MAASIEDETETTCNDLVTNSHAHSKPQDKGIFHSCCYFEDEKKNEWNTEDNFLFEKKNGSGEEMVKKKKCHQRIAHFHLASDFTFVTTAAMRQPNRLSPCKLEAFFHSGRNVFIDQNWTGFTGHLRLRSSTTQSIFS